MACLEQAYNLVHQELVLAEQEASSLGQVVNSWVKAHSLQPAFQVSAEQEDEALEDFLGKKLDVGCKQHQLAGMLQFAQDVP